MSTIILSKKKHQAHFALILWKRISWPWDGLTTLLSPWRNVSNLCLFTWIKRSNDCLRDPPSKSTNENPKTTESDILYSQTLNFQKKKTIAAWRLDIVCYKSQSKIISKCHLISGHLAPHTKGPSPGLSLAVHHHLPHLLLLSDLTAVQGCARSLMGGQIHLWAACAISFTCHRRRQSRCKMWALRNPNPPQKVTLQPTRKSGHHRLASVVSSNLQPGNVWHQYTWLLHWLLRSSLCWHW